MKQKEYVGDFKLNIPERRGIYQSYTSGYGPGVMLCNLTTYVSKADITDKQGNLLYKDWDFAEDVISGGNVINECYPTERGNMTINTIMFLKDEEHYGVTYLNRLCGDNLIFVPVEKVDRNYDIQTLSPTIYWLNNADGFVYNKYTVLGSPINDIPIQVFGAAVMKQAYLGQRTV